VTSTRARAAYVVGLCTLLAAVQLRAEVVQVARGYRPFHHAPQRVPFSWDMFAVKIERCAVVWSPPLSIDGHAVATWRDRGVPVEWDSVTDIAGYEQTARAACAYKTAPTTVTMTCAEVDGQVREHTFPCD
jgi:hypothetical protein